MNYSLLNRSILFSFLMAIQACKNTQQVIRQSNRQEASIFLTELMNKEHEFFGPLMSRKDDLGIQIIYSQIDRNRRGNVSFSDHFFNVNPDNYFYPASTVKFPVAVLALQKLNELKIAGLNKHTTMLTEADNDWQTAVYSDTSSPDGRPSIAHYIKKILLVSDNDAFNRLYEFLGQDYINNSLHKMGYPEVRIIHRLDISLTEGQNRVTNRVRFTDSLGRTVYEKPEEKSELRFQPRNNKLGKGYMQGSQLIEQPFDFSIKNRLGLYSLHSIMKAVLFPETVPKAMRFNLTEDDYLLLRRYMSMRPGESKSPAYAKEDYWDNYVKMIYYGAEKTAPDSNIRIFNKTGTAYGFLIDAVYFADYFNGIEFMLSAVIYCNSDGILNDDHYDYDTLGYPYLKKLGRLVYDHEFKRKRKYPAEFSDFRFTYTD